MDRLSRNHILALFLGVCLAAFWMAHSLTETQRQITEEQILLQAEQNAQSVAEIVRREIEFYAEKAKSLAKQMSKLERLTKTQVRDLQTSMANIDGLVALQRVRMNVSPQTEPVHSNETLRVPLRHSHRLSLFQLDSIRTSVPFSKEKLKSGKVEVHAIRNTAHENWIRILVPEKTTTDGSAESVLMMIFHPERFFFHIQSKVIPDLRNHFWLSDRNSRYLGPSKDHRYEFSQNLSHLPVLRKQSTDSNRMKYFVLPNHQTLYSGVNSVGYSEAIVVFEYGEQKLNQAFAPVREKIQYSALSFLGLLVIWILFLSNHQTQSLQRSNPIPKLRRLFKL